MIQPFFDYKCKGWYPNLNKNLKTRLEATQNKCIGFCLKLGDRKSITVNEFKKNKLAANSRKGQSMHTFLYIQISCKKRT